MSGFNRSHVSYAVEIFYSPWEMLEEIEPKHKRFCANLLREMGFKCVAGAAGSPSTVRELAKEAIHDVVSIKADDYPRRFFAGPHPYIEDDNAIGIWTVIEYEHEL